MVGRQNDAPAPAEHAEALPAANGEHEPHALPPSAAEADMAAGLDLDRLTPLILGLRRTGRLQAAMSACRDMVAAEVKQGIRC